MKFSYTALGNDNQKLTGVLEASSLDVARAELHKMGLSVIALSEAPPEAAVTQEVKEQVAQQKKDTGIVTYYFVAKDPQGKDVNGTIDSNEPYQAYKRLISEYQFQIADLYEQGVADPQAASLKAQFEGWDNMLQQEGIDPHPKAQVGTRSELAEEGEKMSEEIVSEIDKFIINTKKVLQEHKDQYSDAFFAEIEKTLGTLERIRSSNNLKHITQVCNDLYELIAHPDALAESANADQAYKDIVGNLKDSGFIQNRFNFGEKRAIKKKEEDFGKVQGLFSKIQGKLANGEKKSFLSKLINKKPKVLAPKPVKKSSAQNAITKKYFAYLFERNPILRRAKKQEFTVSYNEWKAHKAKAKWEAKKQKKGENAIAKEKRDFSNLFMELDSFFGWLLFFYLAYFFLVSFSLERNVGLSQELVVKTLSSPLIINVSIFLIIAHLTLMLKVRLFRMNMVGSLFLFFFSFGFYTLLMANF